MINWRFSPQQLGAQFPIKFDSFLVSYFFRKSQFSNIMDTGYNMVLDTWNILEKFYGK